MKQVGVDLCTLPEVDGYHYLIVCMTILVIGQR